GRVTPTGPAGQTGLEPATCGFGDRCATNCATALHEDQASCGRCAGSRRSSAARTSDQHTSRTGLVLIRRREITSQRDAGRSILRPVHRLLPRLCSAAAPPARCAADGLRSTLPTVSELSRSWRCAPRSVTIGG